MENRSGEYARRGDYHVRLEQDWPYLPVYLEKIKLARAFLDECSRQEVIYDMGCGEGVLVDEYRKAGYNITGMDANYASATVIQRSFLNSGLDANSVDVIVCLDVLEHLIYSDQEKAIAEFARILKAGGRALMTVPNLAHLASRLSFLVTGKLIRTSGADRHPGDRPVWEYIQLFKKHFKIRRRVGLFPTFPLLSLLTLHYPSRVVWMHRLYNRLLGFPNICFLNVFYLEKK
ncbi:MAG: class I SAM-dependent methyltransferase [Chloroflexi bacterium]|nr:class I SAM-dependent methyltransferase [Chloroflexota bacterium]